MGQIKRHGPLGSVLTRRPNSHKTAKRRAIKAQRLAELKARRSR